MSWHPTATKLCKYQWDLIQHPVCWIDGSCGTGENELMVEKDNSDIYFARTIQAIRFSYIIDISKIPEIQVPDKIENQKLKLINFSDNDFLKKLNVAIRDNNTFCSTPKEGTLVISTPLKWTGRMNDGLKFDLNSADHKYIYRIYVESDAINSEKEELFLNYINNGDQKNWVEDFEIALNESDENFSLYMASYPMIVYEKIPKEYADKFLNQVLHRNYFSAILTKKYGSYLCDVTKYLLKNDFNYDKKISCDDFKNYKSLNELIESNSTYLYKNYTNFISQFNKRLNCYCCYANCGIDPNNCKGSIPSKGCKGHTNTCCWQTCILNLQDIGLTPVENSERIDMVDHTIYKATLTKDNHTLVPSNSFEAGIKAIDNSLLIKHEPIMVGVFHKMKKPVTYNYPDYATYHFIIIVGKDIDENGKWYYQFVDVGTANHTHDITNRLYINLDKKIISGKCPYKDYNYILTEVRPNIN